MFNKKCPTVAHVDGKRTERLRVVDVVELFNGHGNIMRGVAGCAQIPAMALPRFPTGWSTNPLGRG